MLVMHATTQMNPKWILLREKKQDPKGYILFDSIHMTLWKGKATGMETVLAHPDNPVEGRGVADYKKNSGHRSLQYWGGKYMALCICQNTTHLYILKGAL